MELNMINIPEILVANGTGAFLVLFLLLYRIRIDQTNRFDEKTYNLLLIVTFIATLCETLSFLIDGKIGFIFYILQYISNTIAAGISIIIGYCWCLFVEYQIYRNFDRIKKKSKILAIPLIIAIILLIINLCGTGIIFDISKKNEYTRGPANFILYIIVFMYYIEIQISISFIDDLSGLYNRKYMNHYLNKLQNNKTKHVYGFLMDINDFKAINDTYGHLKGDHALIQFGKILQHSIDKDSVAIRMGGDEFVIFAKLQSDAEAIKLKKRIENNVRQFNIHGKEPFHLSFSIGITKFNGKNIDAFLSAMDDSMYEAKNMHRLMQ